MRGNSLNTTHKIRLKDFPQSLFSYHVCHNMLFAGKDYVLPTKDNIMMCFITELVYKRNPNPSPSFCTNPRSFPSSLSTPVPAVKSGVGVRWLTAGGTHWWADWWSRQLSPHPGSRVLCNWSTSGSDQQSDQTRLSTDQIAICTLQVNPMQSHTGPSSSFQVKINEQKYLWLEPTVKRQLAKWRVAYLLVHSHVKRTTAYKFDLRSSYSLQNIWMWD